MSTENERPAATAEQIIALMNRSVADLIAAGCENAPRTRELQHLLGRITAHREGIRSIEACGD